MKRDAARTAAVLVVFAASLYLLRGLLAPICWAGVIAIGSWPLHERLMRRTHGWGHGVSAALLTGAAMLLVIAPFAWLVQRGLHELPAAIRLWTASRETGLSPPLWLERVPLIGNWLLGVWQTTIGPPGALADYVHGFFSDISFTTGRALALRVGHRAMAFFFCLVVLFFLYLDGARLARQIEAVLARQFGPSAVATQRLAVQAVRGTINGLILVGLGLAVLMTVVYVIAGVPHPALFGLATGLLGVVPFGAGVALIVVVLYLFALGANSAALAVLTIGAVTIFITDHFIRPLFITGASRLPLVLALLGIVAGLETFGILGIFIGPTLLAVTLTIWRELSTEPSPPEVGDA